MTSPHDELQEVIDQALAVRKKAGANAGTAELAEMVRTLAEGLAATAHYIQAHLDHHLNREHEGYQR